MDLLSTATEWQLLDPDGNPLAQHPFAGRLPHIGSGRIVPAGYEPGLYRVESAISLQMGGPGVSAAGLDERKGEVTLTGDTFWLRIARPLHGMPSVVKAPSTP